MAASTAVRLPSCRQQHLDGVGRGRPVRWRVVRMDCSCTPAMPPSSSSLPLIISWSSPAGGRQEQRDMSDVLPARGPLQPSSTAAAARHWCALARKWCPHSCPQEPPALALASLHYRWCFDSCCVVLESACWAVKAAHGGAPARYCSRFFVMHASGSYAFEWRAGLSTHVRWDRGCSWSTRRQLLQIAAAID